MGIMKCSNPLLPSFSDDASNDDGVLRSVGGLESVASTLFQELTDSAMYLKVLFLLHFHVFR